MGRSTLEIKGFDEFYQKLLKMSKNADEVASKKFEECLDILDEELRTKAQKSGLSPRLVNKITRKTWGGRAGHGIWIGEVGWEKTKAKKPLTDTYKVIFYNYGSPQRKVKTDKLRVNIDGKWVTLSLNRGEIVKRGFIKRAKQAANKRTKALMKSTIHEMLNEGE